MRRYEVRKLEGEALPYAVTEKATGQIVYWHKDRHEADVTCDRFNARRGAA